MTYAQTHLPTITASLLAASLTVGATLAFAAPAHAASLAATDEAPRATVNYGDLDMATAKGRVTLAHRIARAARAVCADNLSASDRLQAQIDFNHCRDAAIAHANASLATRGLAGEIASR